MPFDTALTRMLGIDIPVISAPMAGVAGGKLAAAVTGGGGLGLIGGGYPDPAVIEHEFGEAGNAVVGLASSLGRWLKTQPHWMSPWHTAQRRYFYRSRISRPSSRKHSHLAPR